MSQFDDIKWQPHAHIDKYSPEVVRELTEFLGYEPTSADFARLTIDPNRVTEVEGNLLTTAGLQRVTNLIIGSGAAAFNATQAIVGVGDSATGEVVGNTTLGANGANARYQLVDSVPTAVNGVITAVMTVTTGNGNFAWNEWCWAIATGTITAGNTLASVGTSPQMLNRKTASMGTKAAGATWVFTTTVTLS